MKKLLSVILMLVLSMGSIDVYAYKIPSSFWSIDAKYQTSVENKDYKNIIQYAKQEIACMQNEPENEQVLQIIGSRTEMIAKSYEALENYPQAADFFEQYINQ